MYAWAGVAGVSDDGEVTGETVYGIGEFRGPWGGCISLGLISGVFITAS